MISDIDPKIYGNFLEHLGRCIEGGVFDEGSPLSDANGFRRDVLDAAKKLGVTLLRWPGGNFSSNYHWNDDIGPRDQRPRRASRWRGEPSRPIALAPTSSCSTRNCWARNLTSARIWGPARGQEVQQWVVYCNSSEDTAMTRLAQTERARAAVEALTHWGLGNEIDGPWQMGHRSADDYGKFALEAAKLMKLTDPDIKLVAAGSSNFGSGFRLDRVEPDDPRISEAPCRLPVAAYLRRQSE